MWGTLGLVLGGLVLLGGALLEGIDSGSSSGSSAPPADPSPSPTSPPPRSSAPRRSTTPPFAVPRERDEALRSFSVVNPEGEVYDIDTASSASVFYGPGWTRILSVYAEKPGDVLRARASMRIRDKENRFAGYQVWVDHVSAFLPRSRSGCFADETRDATGKCLLVRPLSVHPSGRYQGNLVVEAETAYRTTMGQEDRCDPGVVLWGLAVDHDGTTLEVVLPRGRRGRIPAAAVDHLLQQAGLPKDLNFATGHFLPVQVLDRGPWGRLPLAPAGYFYCP